MRTKIDDIITANVLHLMETYGLTCSALAKAAGVHQPNLYRILRGQRRWTVPHVVAVAEVLGVHPATLLVERAPATRRKRAHRQ